MTKLRLQDLDVKNKKVLMRVDFNVPLKEDGTPSDTTRLKESLPSIKHILEAGGSVILMSHLGRPKGVDPKLSLKAVVKPLSHLLGQKILMAPDCIGDQTQQMARSLQKGEILLLENLRFYPAEEKPSLDPTFAQKLASFADFYVNDAFGTAHRAHSSTAEIARYFPKKAAAGLLLQKEMKHFEPLLSHPKRPFYVIIGGAKISTKMGVLKSLLPKVDGIFIGGGMAFTFLKAQGKKIGDSIHEEDQIPIALEFLKACSEKKIPLWLPTDLVVANRFAEDASSKIVSLAEGIPDGWQGMDIGPRTREEWKKSLQNAATLFWNGPLGVFEFPHFAKGTQEIAHALAKLKAITIVGGGDSIAAIQQAGLADQFSHLSTGGGAALEYLEFGHLPGIDALSEKK
jgi:phosphoglycerate kinase